MDREKRVRQAIRKAGATKKYKAEEILRYLGEPDVAKAIEEWKSYSTRTPCLCVRHGECGV